jgi:ABC-type lipoprotein export system ATPase subunit
VKYAGTTPLDDVSIRLEPGCTAVIGPSGSGKSTLLRVIAGQQRPTGGVVAIDGVEVAAASWRSSGDPRVALIHQDYRLVPFLTVEQNLLLAAELRGIDRSTDDVVTALERVALLPAMSSRLPGTMSGGEQQRVAIARSLLTGAPVVLADEPTGALDLANTDRVTDILVNLGRQERLVIVVATHDARVAQRMDHHLQLVNGKLEPAG